MKSIPPIHKMAGYLTGNIYFIESDDGGLVVVDTGIPRDYGLIVDRIKSLGRSPVEVSHIILTHFHIDHAGSAAALRRLSHAKVYAHKDDVPFMQGEKKTKRVRRLGVLGRAASLAPRAADRFTSTPPVQVDRPLEDGEVIPILGGIRVIHSPGHTPGSACYYWPEKRVLFTGDTIINSYHLLALPTIGFSSNFEEAAKSAAGVVDRMEGEELSILCPGHGPLVTERTGEKLQRFRGRLIKGGRV